MFKNVASQKIELFAFDTTTGIGKSGDAANITPYLSKDQGTVTVLGTTTATEMDATNAKGWYSFVLTQAESNFDAGLFTGKSATANIAIVGRPINTNPPLFTTLAVDASGRVDLGKLLGTAVTAATAGIMDVNTKNINNVAAATPGAAGGLFIAGTNAATSITTGLTSNLIGNITGALSGSVGSVTGAVGSVTGAVGSVTGAVGSVTGAVGSVTGAVGSVTAAVSVTGDLSATMKTSVATAVWTDTTGSDFTTALSVGKSVMNGVTLGTGLTVVAVSGAVGSVTGAVGSVTGAVGSVTGAVGSVTGAVGSVTGNVGGSVASLTTNNDKTGYRMSATGVGDILTTALTEAYAADGVAPTLSQLLFLVQSALTEFAIAGTTITTKKMDKSTTAATYTLDSSTTPTSRTRAT